MGWVLLKSGTFGANSSDPDTVGSSTGDWSTTSAGNPDFLHIIINSKDSGVGSNFEAMFNDDHTSKYTDASVANDDTPDGRGANRSDFRLTGSHDARNFFTLDIVNKTGHPKIGRIQSSNNATSRGDGHFKYTVSGKIISMQILTESSSHAIVAGGTYAVYGAVDTTYTHPNLPAGTIFEQTDDYKYYMWDGTDTWTVMVAN